jgi:hypothetical protein
MPSRKQRRRREKDRRHEYEYVYVDDEGHELAVDEVEPEVAQQNGAAKKRDTPRGDGSRPGTKPKALQQAGRKGAREVQPPAWSRVLKRAGIFAPFMFASIYLIDRNLGMPGTLLVTAQMLAVFIPFSYLMDRTLYRRFLRQSEAAAPAKGARRRT